MAKPEHKLIVITCMDARINPYTLLGIDTGSAHILRNAGPVVTEDVIRSVLLSVHVFGTNQIILLTHTDCGLKKVGETALKAALKQRFDAEEAIPEQFYGYTDLKAHTDQQLKKIKEHPLIGQDVKVRGMIFDVDTGQLNEVT